MVDDGISGKPFIRVGSVGTDYQGFSPPTRSDSSKLNTTALPEQKLASPPPVPKSNARPAPQMIKDGKYRRSSEEVAVGISRLHMVSLPLLQMKPIYWSPVNDIALVTRATWFYRFAPVQSWF
jgi:hypothetical protein